MSYYTHYTLEIEMIPRSSFFKNLRNALDPKDWDILRREAYAKAGYCCSRCGVDGVALHAHEVWEFDDITRVQRLIDIVALCPSCHEVIHFGLAQLNGRAEIAAEHFVATNHCTYDDLDEHYLQAHSIWQRRSRRRWELDISLITDRGIFPVK